ncbi:MAG: hypothetical protein HFI64_00755 [Lachnospiraceae bacterium]|nr:hypothetical protein [Lachnospiraceae bacterium]
MTGQLLRVTTTPYRSVRISQNARLVSSDSVDLERRKAIARMRAFKSQHSSGGAIADAGYDFVNEINRTFSTQSSQHSTAPSSQDSAAASVDNQASTNTSGSEMVSGENVISSSTSGAVTSSDVQAAAVSAESSSAYTMERGAFEFKVAKGDVAFLPPLTMTVMTQRPEIHFEYLGGHNYVPPEKFNDDGFMNLLA